MSIGVEPILVALVMLLFSVAALFYRSLTLDGVLAAVAVGTVSYTIGGLADFAALIVFIVVGDTATRVSRKDETAHEERNWANVLGNTAAAVLAASLGSPIGFFGAVSAAFSDTLSSEIGMLSKKKPVLITEMKEVEKGTDGGVTLLGLASALVGGIIIGATYFAAVHSMKGFSAIVLAGVAGSIVDSLLGATLQKKGLIGNNQVNFVASLAGAAIASAAMAMIA